MTFDALPGWRNDRIAEALPALKASCGVFARKPEAASVGDGGLARPAKDWQRACEGLAAATTDEEIRRAIEANFTPVSVTAADTGATGTFTGYYEAELLGARSKDATHTVPIYGVPRDLVTVDLSSFVDKLPPTVPRQIVGRVAIDSRGRSLLPYFTRAEIDADKAVADNADVLLWVDDPVSAHILHIQGSGQIGRAHV